MDDKQRAFFLASYNEVLTRMEEIFAPPRKTHNRTQKIKGEALAEAKGLKLFEFKNGSVYARNEKEAVKRAMKRGLL